MKYNNTSLTQKGTKASSAFSEKHTNKNNKRNDVFSTVAIIKTCVTIACLIYFRCFIL